MFSFRQKIFISYIAVFVLFIGIMSFFTTYSVKNIVLKGMRDTAFELIERIRQAPDQEELILRLKQEKSRIFFRVSIISNERKILYDSHTKRLLGSDFSQEYVVSHPEVLEAIEMGDGYYEDYSELLGQKFSYFATSFDFQGKNYILRTAFPYKYVLDMTHDVEIGFIVLSASVLLFYGLFSWFIINYLTSPIHLITDRIKSYKEGKDVALPQIPSPLTERRDEFGDLARTLNSLSKGIVTHINSLTFERNEKESVLESLMEGVLAVDKSMVVTYANHMALKFLLIDKQDIISSPFREFHQPVCFSLLNQCQKKNTILKDTLEIQNHNEKRFLDIIAVPQKNGNGAILILHDQSTHYKLLEMRKEFIANASHELKTPITIIRGFAETLHDNPDLSRKIMGEITEKIVSNCRRMTTIIRDLITLADIENLPESRLISCDLIDLAQRGKETTLDLFPDAVVDLQYDPDTEYVFPGDPNLLELALTNLLENSGKYSKQPAHITISVKKMKKKICISIQDKGIGIPKSELEHIFDRFYTVNKTHSQKMGGSGLGLSIVQTIVEKHGGAISVHSELGKGTTFVIEFPI